MDYQEILKRKQEYYGETPASYEFAAEEYASQSKWISVEERLPRMMGDMECLVVKKNGVILKVSFCRFEVEEGFYTGNYNFAINKEITHWMELPAPPPKSSIPTDHEISDLRNQHPKG